MKIGFFSETYRPDINGVITSMESFRAELERAGHTVYVFAPGEDLFPIPWKKSKRERNVFRFNSFQYPLYKSIRVAIPFNVPVARKIQRLGLDLVHSHTPFSMGLFAQWVARQHDIPHIHTYHTLYPEYAKFYFPGFKKWNEKGAEKLSAIFCNATTEVIAPSDGIKRKLRGYGITKPITTLPTGVDRVFFDTKGTDGIRRKYKVPPRAPLLITVTRLGREKSVDFLLKSFARVLKDRPDAHYLLVGDGPARMELETLARELGVADRVVFTGFIRDRREIVRTYAASDVFLFASRTDTQCLTMLEAAATGLPLVAIRDKPLETALTNGSNGYFVNGERVEAFARAVTKILDDRPLARKLGSASRKLARGQSAERRTGELLELYDRAIATEQKLPDTNAFKTAARRVSAAFRTR